MDYSFFDDALQARFTTQLDQLGVAWSVAADPMGGNCVTTSDDLDDDVSDQVEEIYDALLDEQAQLAEANAEWVKRRVAGVQVTLPNGEPRTIALDSHTSNRLLENFSAEEVQQLVQAIADALSRDYYGPLCKIPLDQLPQA